MIHATELVEACDDTSKCELAIARIFEGLARGNRREGLELAVEYLPRVLAAQRKYEATLLAIFDELTKRLEKK